MKEFDEVLSFLKPTSHPLVFISHIHIMSYYRCDLLYMIIHDFKLSDKIVKI